MKNKTILSAIALAEFLCPYASAHNFIAEPYKDTVAIEHDGTEISIDAQLESAPRRILEIALGFSENELDKQVTEKDFHLFVEREEFLDNLPPETEEEREDDISEIDRSRFVD